MKNILNNFVLCVCSFYRCLCLPRVAHRPSRRVVEVFLMTFVLTVIKCNFEDLYATYHKCHQFLDLPSIPIAAIAFAWAGWILVTSGGSESKKEQAKEIFTKVAIGFIFVPVCVAYCEVYYHRFCLIQRVMKTCSTQTVLLLLCILLRIKS